MSDKKRWIENYSTFISQEMYNEIKDMPEVKNFNEHKFHILQPVIMGYTFQEISKRVNSD